MGKQVILDPEKLQVFAGQLDLVNHEVGDTIRRLTHLYKQLGDTWRDTEYQKFVDEFDRTILNLRRFNSTTENTVRVLRKTAARGREVYGDR